MSVINFFWYFIKRKSNHFKYYKSVFDHWIKKVAFQNSCFVIKMYLGTKASASSHDGCHMTKLMKFRHRLCCMRRTQRRTHMSLLTLQSSQCSELSPSLQGHLSQLSQCWKKIYKLGKKKLCRAAPETSPYITIIHTITSQWVLLLN